MRRSMNKMAKQNEEKQEEAEVITKNKSHN